MLFWVFWFVLVFFFFLEEGGVAHPPQFNSNNLFPNSRSLPPPWPCQQLRTTVFKKSTERNYKLKMKASRYFYSEMNDRCESLPFSLRSFADENKARFGVVECLKHDLVYPYALSAL